MLKRSLGGEEGGSRYRSEELKQTKVKAESRVKENQALITSVENPVHRILFLHAFLT